MSGAEILQTLISLKDAPDGKKKTEEWLDRLDIIVENGYVPEHSETITTEDCSAGSEGYGTYVQTYVAGYTARKMIASTQCCDCSKALRCDRQHECNRLVSLMSKGELVQPSEALFRLLSAIESAFRDVVGADLHLTANSVLEVMDVLLSRNMPLVGCSTHRGALTKPILHFYVVAMGHFVGHSYNRAHNEKREKSRHLRKVAKLY